MPPNVTVDLFISEVLVASTLYVLQYVSTAEVEPIAAVRTFSRFPADSTLTAFPQLFTDNPNIASVVRKKYRTATRVRSSTLAFPSIVTLRDTTRKGSFPGV